MSLQKLRADFAGPPDPSRGVAWFTRWIGGPSLALVRDCPTPFGARTVYVTGEPDTWFSQPAACVFRKRTIRGYLTREDGIGWTFRPYKYGKGCVFPIVEESEST